MQRTLPLPDGGSHLTRFAAVNYCTAYPLDREYTR
jgi:hypothetical protein